MRLITSNQFGTLEIDFYIDNRRDVFVTIEQLAQGFGYKNKKSIERMLERNSYLRKKEFSIIEKVHHSLGGTQETRLFNKRGIFEIGMLSRTEKGKEFRQWLYEYLEKLEKENFNFKIARALEKPQRKTLTEAIKNWEHYNKWSYKQITDLLLKKVTGMNAKQLKANRQSKTTALDVLTAKELQEYTVLENAVIGLISLNKSYLDIVSILFNK